MEQISQRCLRSFCVRLVNIASELERVLGRKKTFEIIGIGNEKGLVELTKEQMRKRGAIKDFEDFKEFQREQMNSPFFSNILGGLVSHETKEAITFHITRCLWAENFRQMNASELGYVVCCHPDFALAQIFHPKIGLRRNKTLMEGDRYCNHTYYWKE